MNINSPEYWNKRWLQKQTGWDIGYASTSIIAFMNQYPDRDAAILIPGCGNAYEAEALYEKGFRNITLLDISDNLVKALEEKFRSTSIKVVCDDFFNHQGYYNVIIEQTFFCALPPVMRAGYAQQAHQLLQDKGKVIGLLFDREFEQEGPPFGGSKAEYSAYFQPYFRICKMETCYNSIPPRQGSELFIHLEKQ